MISFIPWYIHAWYIEKEKNYDQEKDCLMFTIVGI